MQAGAFKTCALYASLCAAKCVQSNALHMLLCPAVQLVRWELISRSWCRGVSWHKASERWRASIKIGGKKVSLGSYVDEEQAARVFDSEAVRHGLMCRALCWQGAVLPKPLVGVCGASAQAARTKLDSVREQCPCYGGKVLSAERVYMLLLRIQRLRLSRSATLHSWTTPLLLQSGGTRACRW